MDQDMYGYSLPNKAGRMTKAELAESEIAFMLSLAVGDPVEVFDDRSVVEWGGTLEEIAPELGVAWVRTDAGERRLLDVQEHSIRRLPYLQ
jgi:hypothetical protein